MRFKSSYTRDIAGIFDQAGSFLNGSDAFEDAMDLASLGATDNSAQETVMRLRAMKAMESGNLKTANAIQRKILTINANRQSKRRGIALGNRAGMDKSELRLNARVAAWNNPAQNMRKLDVMRRDILQDQTVSQDALVKAQENRLKSRFEDMAVVDLGPIRFSQGNQAASWFQSLNGLDEDTILSAAQAVAVAKVQAKKLAMMRKKIVKKELKRLAKVRGVRPSYFTARYGSSFSPMEGFDAIQTVDAQTASMTVAELQELLLANGAEPTRLVNKAGKPDGIGGEGTQIQAQKIGRKLGYEVVSLEYYANKRSVRVKPSGFITAMQGTPATAPGNEVKSTKVSTRTLQEVLLKLGSPSAGLVGKNGKPDGKFGSKTAAALSAQAKANNLPLSTVKKSGKMHVVVAPDTTWLALAKLSNSKPADVGSGPVTVSTKEVQSVLLTLGSSNVGLVGKDGKPDGRGGPRTMDAVRSSAAKFGLPVAALKFAGFKKKNTVITPATTWHELTKKSGEALASKSSTTASSPTATATERSFASTAKVSDVQRWLLNMGAPRKGLVNSTTGNPDGKWGKSTEAALKKTASSMGYHDIATRVTKGGAMVQLSPPELQSALVQGTSGRQTTTVETSEDTQLKQAKSEIAQEAAKPKKKWKSKKSKAAPGPAPTLNKQEQLVSRAQAASKDVRDYLLANGGRAPKIKIASVDSFQRAFKANGPKGPTKKKLTVDSKWGPTTREAVSAILNTPVDQLPISAWDRGAPKVDQVNVSDKAQEKIEEDKIQEKRTEDKTDGAATLPMAPTDEDTGTKSNEATQSDEEDETPFYKKPLYWAGVVGVLGVVYLSKKKSRSAYLPVG